MSKPFPHLFSPLALRHKTLRNRIVFGAHGRRKPPPIGAV